MKKYIFILLAMLGVFPVIGMAKEAPFPQVGNWYTVVMPGSTVQGTSFETQLTVKILQNTADQWCFVLSEKVTLPSSTNGQVVVREEKFWLNFAQATSAWPSGEIDRAYYKKTYAGGLKVEQATAP
jgi:hypothetical protein